MKNDLRRRLLQGSLALLAAAALPGLAQAAELTVQQPGQLSVAVYADFAPWSHKGKGIDVDLGKALAGKLGLSPSIVEFTADEDMNDDLRNMVWKGHYLGRRPADVMLHVPVDARLAASNEQVTIFAPYHVEALGMARDASRIGAPKGSAANAFEVFTREKVGVELTSLADDYMLSVLHGRLRENVVHFTNVNAAVEALQKGEVAAAMGTYAELQAALAGNGSYTLDVVDMPELRIRNWAVGMAVKADNPDLAAALSGALEQLRASGELAEIFTRHGVTLATPGGNP